MIIISNNMIIKHIIIININKVKDKIISININNNIKNINHKIII